MKVARQSPEPWDITGKENEKAKDGDYQTDYDEGFSEIGHGERSFARLKNCVFGNQWSGCNRAQDRNLQLPSKIPVLLAEDTATVLLAVETESLGNSDPLLPPAAEIVVVKTDAILFPESLPCFPNQIMLLISTIEE